ncbi:hypothetical protein N0V90_006405 [Kalmusia sp. IMI 367209]|nr:hypothetical protein N0V90_006405 [Kalmusia sp. IMI 367209]
MPDFTRFAKSRRAPLAMIPTIPIVRTIYAILGIAMTGAGRVLYQEDIWNPAGSNWRAAVVQLFFAAICIPGLVNTIEPTINIPVGFKRIYDLNWFINTVGALIGYWAVCALFPERNSLVSVTISEVITGTYANEDHGSIVVMERLQASGESK